MRVADLHCKSVGLCLCQIWWWGQVGNHSQVKTAKLHCKSAGLCLCQIWYRWVRLEITVKIVRFHCKTAGLVSLSNLVGRGNHSHVKIAKLHCKTAGLVSLSNVVVGGSWELPSSQDCKVTL